MSSSFRFHCLNHTTTTSERDFIIIVLHPQVLHVRTWFDGGAESFRDRYLDKQGGTAASTCPGHLHSERISDHILRVSVRAGGVPSVRVTGPCAPTGVRIPKGPGLGRSYAVHRQPVGPRRPDGGESRDLGAIALSAARG